MKNIDAEKVFNLYKIFLTIITIISGVCLLVGIIKGQQILIEMPVLATIIVIVVIYLRDLIIRKYNKSE